MVEYTISLDNVFQSLADPTRRDILKRVSEAPLSVGQIAKYYDLTFAAVSKHLKVLEKARLINKRKQGKKQIVSATPETLHETADYLKQYEAMWHRRLDALDNYLKQGN